MEIWRYGDMEIWRYRGIEIWIDRCQRDGSGDRNRDIRYTEIHLDI